MRFAACAADTAHPRRAARERARGARHEGAGAAVLVGVAHERPPPLPPLLRRAPATRQARNAERADLAVRKQRERDASRASARRRRS